MIRQKLFSGATNHSVTIVEAIDFINSFRTHSAPGAYPGGFFDKRVLRNLVQQPGAVGLRYYYGLDANGREVLLLVGTGADRKDLIAGESVKVSLPTPPVTVQGTYDADRVNHAISLEDAARLTAEFSTHKDPAQPYGGFFSKMAIQQVLDQPACIGIRFVFGEQKDATRAIVLIGVNLFCMDMFYGNLMEMSSLCPPFCDINLLHRGHAFHLSDREYAEPDAYCLESAA